MKKSAKANYFYNTLYTVLNMLLPLVTVPYLSRILKTEGIGIYAFCFSIAQYFVLIAKLGLVNYGTREISKNAGREEKTVVFWNLFAMQILSTLLASLAYVAYLILFAKENQLISLIFLGWIIFSFLDIDWFWFGEEEFKKVSVRNIVIKILTVISVFALVKREDQVWLYAAIMVIGYVIGYVSIWLGINKKISYYKPQLAQIKRHLYPCLVMLIPVLALNIYRSMDKVMLGAISGMDETGIYENGEKLIYCASSLISSLGTVMMPKITALVKAKKEERAKEYFLKSLKFVMIMTSAIAFGFMAISNSVIPIIFGSDFNRSSGVLLLCAPILIFMGWSNVFRTQYIIPRRLDGIYIKSITIGSIINLLLNFIFIPRYGAIGAVIGTLATEAFVPFYQFMKLRKKIAYYRYFKETIAYLLIGLIMFVLLKAIEYLLEPGLKALIIQIIIGSLLFMSATYLYIRLKDAKLYAYINGLIKKKGKYEH